MLDRAAYRLLSFFCAIVYFIVGTNGVAHRKNITSALLSTVVYPTKAAVRVVGFPPSHVRASIPVSKKFVVSKR